MGETAQKRAIATYRSRLAARGIARFEVQALAIDRELIRDLARRMTAIGPEAARLRGTIQQAIEGEPRTRGRVLAGLLSAPKSDDIDFTRSRDEPRKIDL